MRDVLLHGYFYEMCLCYFYSLYNRDTIMMSYFGAVLLENTLERCVLEGELLGAMLISKAVKNQ